jgi:hypothetical protein
MSFRFAAQILQNSHVILANLGTKSTKVHNLGTEQILIIHPLPRDGVLITQDDAKFLNAYSISEELEATLKGRLKLSKRITHAWVSGNKFFYWDRFGDANSVILEDLYNAPEYQEPEKGQNPTMDTTFQTIESGNFSTLTSCATVNLNLTG